MFEPSSVVAGLDFKSKGIEEILQAKRDPSVAGFFIKFLNIAEETLQTFFSRVLMLLIEGQDKIDYPDSLTYIQYETIFLRIISSEPTNNSESDLCIDHTTKFTEVERKAISKMAKLLLALKMRMALQAIDSSRDQFLSEPKKKLREQCESATHGLSAPKRNSLVRKLYLASDMLLHYFVAPLVSILCNYVYYVQSQVIASTRWDDRCESIIKNITETYALYRFPEFDFADLTTRIFDTFREHLETLPSLEIMVPDASNQFHRVRGSVQLFISLAMIEGLFLRESPPADTFLKNPNHSYLLSNKRLIAFCSTVAQEILNLLRWFDQEISKREIADSPIFSFEWLLNQLRSLDRGLNYEQIESCVVERLNKLSRNENSLNADSSMGSCQKSQSLEETKKLDAWSKWRDRLKLDEQSEQEMLAKIHELIQGCESVDAINRKLLQNVSRDLLVDLILRYIFHQRPEDWRTVWNEFCKNVRRNWDSELENMCRWIAKRIVLKNVSYHNV
ncbi:MAG: hypothetical protein NZO16_04550 [Deltaproteobacteria bacterium]|nr:hypothetical protein [Deltaproteobacteria bacterium]